MGESEEEEAKNPAKHRKIKQCTFIMPRSQRYRHMMRMSDLRPVHCDVALAGHNRILVNSQQNVWRCGPRRRRRCLQPDGRRPRVMTASLFVAIWLGCWKTRLEHGPRRRQRQRRGAPASKHPDNGSFQILTE